jgi:hypothetical protein
MAGAAPEASKSHRRVRFPEQPVTMGWNIWVEPGATLWEYKAKKRKPNYCLSKEIRDLDPEKEAERAIREARALAQELEIEDSVVPAAAAGDGEGPRRWLVDTGSAYNLIGRADVPEWHLEDAEPTRHAVELMTANGRTVVEEEILMQCAALRTHVSPLLLNSSPAVLSVGRRCVEDGFSFHWPAGGTPTLTAPDGTVHKLVVESPLLATAPRRARSVCRSGPLRPFRGR